jgi:hypothetical protein
VHQGRKKKSFANYDTREDAANLVRAGDIETLLSADQLKVGLQLLCPQIIDKVKLEKIKCG